MKWVIVDDDGDYWNNEEGWVENRGDATEFTELESQAFNLPVGGTWVYIF